ncbi:MAG: SRPBCC family protein [Planctomycetes bacterium]|nr:SRPBCC family protein [Planctomycetota bacterium]
MTSTDTSDREIVTARMIAAPRERVFQAWADATQLAQWWGPDGFTNTFDEFAFCPGGEWRFTMHGPDGGNYVNHSVFVEITPPERIVMDHISAPQFRVIATFDDVGGKTLFTFRGIFPTVAEYDKVKGFAIAGNQQTCDRLVKLVEHQA